MPRKRFDMKTFHESILLTVMTAFLMAVPITAIHAQLIENKGDDQQGAVNKGKEEPLQAPAKVDVNPVAHDDEIGSRLQKVLDATGWFDNTKVRVEEGVVFLNGETSSDELKKWAGDLARSTQDVVAVANRISVMEPSITDFGPAWVSLNGLLRDLVRSLPFLTFAILILAISMGFAVLVTRWARSFFEGRVRAHLLRDVIARGIGILALLIGIYVVLRVSGLTQLALTVVGGTGLIGLAVGIAFRDITENFLASIFLSIQRPFETRDLVEVAGITGYIQQLNVRTTILMTLDGNVVQIPNAAVYKSTLRNFTTNRNRRDDFAVGIGYCDPIDQAQEVARKVLSDHPAVLKDPEPWVLVDKLGSSTVNLRVYFWLDGHEHSWLKVRSSVIRLIKLAFQQHGISMPDESREVVFPQGIKVTVAQENGNKPTAPDQNPIQNPKTVTPNVRDGAESISTKAESGLSSEAAVIKEQARKVKPLKEKENLLKEPTEVTNELAIQN